MFTAVATTIEISPEESALLVGDLSKLNEGQRADLVLRICRSVGLNPLTKPLLYLQYSGRLVLYTTKDATDQLRRLHNVSTAIVSRERMEDVYVVTARCTLPNNRTEERIGAVVIGGMKGEALCNALMKAETKAVRRCTLAACGLGFLDETELDTMPASQVRQVDVTTGEITHTPAAQQLPPPERLADEAAYTAIFNASEELARIIGMERMTAEYAEVGVLAPNMTRAAAVALYKRLQTAIEAERTALLEAPV